jgi:putative ABC transport system permease protein
VLLDVRYALRTLLRNRNFTFVSVLALALGIGANTAMFSMVYAVLLKPLPYKQPDRLVWIALRDSRLRSEMVSVPDFLAWRSQSHSFDSLAAFMPLDQTLTGREDPIDVRTTFCSEAVGRLFGVQPILGRDFSPDELTMNAQAEPALISYHFYQAHFGGSPSALGQTIVLNSQPHRVTGVLPASFRLALPTPFGPQLETDIILPYRVDPAIQRRNSRLLMMSAMRPFILNGQPYSVQVLGRLRSGVSLATARAELKIITSRLPEPSFVEPGSRQLIASLLRDRILGNTGRPLLVLLGAVGFVLLIACVNVANLLLSRAAARGRERALRMALGAIRARVVRQLLTESLLLALIGGVGGVLLAACCIRLLVNLSPVSVPHLKDTGIEPAVLAFSLAISALTGILFGIAPSLSSTRSDLNEALKQGSTALGRSVGRRRMQGLLVVSEVALALVLLTGAGLTIKSMWLMHASVAAAAPDRVLIARLQVNGSRASQPAQQTGFVEEFLARVESIPGVRAAATSHVTMPGMLHPEGSSAEPIKTNITHVTNHYFLASGMRLLKGRIFGDNDREGAPLVAIVNESLARRLSPDFPRQTPVDRRIPMPVGAAPMAPPVLATVIGVVSDFRSSRLDAEPEPGVYLTEVQDSVGPDELMVRASSDPTALIYAIRQQGHAMSDIALRDPKTLAERLNGSVAPLRFQMTLLIAFAGLAVLLALIGIYGVVSYMVTQRARELGIRVALGAQRAQVVSLVLAGGLRLVGAGIILGLAASFTVARLMASFLYGVKPTDSFTYAAVSIVVLGVSAIAAWLPARRAASIDPTIALHYE